MINEEEPLWLPKGSIRALIALALVIAVCSITAATGTVPKELLAVVSVIIGFYFGVKVSGR